MSSLKKREVNCIFAVHFDDVDDPRYKEITSLIVNTKMRQKRNLVFIEACDSFNDMTHKLNRLNGDASGE